MSVSFNPCSTANGFPFHYFAEDGSTVDGNLNEDGICTFDEAYCGLTVPVKYCCVATKEAAKTGSVYMYTAFLVCLIPVFYRRVFMKRNRTDAEREEAQSQEKKMVPSWVPERRKSLFTKGMILFILALIIVPIFMRDSIQNTLSVKLRNALIAAEAFLVPFQLIFQFIEDIVLVRVNYALGVNDKKLTNQMVHIGILSSVGMGLVAAVIGTVLGVIPETLRALTNPGGANDRSLYPGCDLIPNDQELREEVLPFWLITVWSLVGVYMGLVFSGFLFGALQLHLMGWLGAISAAITPMVWFLSARKSLTILALSSFGTSWCLPILSVLYMISPLGKELAENTGVNLRLSSLLTSLKPGQDDNDDYRLSVVPLVQNNTTNDLVQTQSEILDEGTEISQHNDGQSYSDPSNSVAALPSHQDADHSTKKIFIEGLKIMTMDLIIQACLTLGVYLSLLVDGSEAYEISSMQSALPAYGLAYAFGMGLMLKIMGAQFLAAGKFDRFASLARVTVASSFLLVPIIVGCVVPFHSGLAYDYGANACEYAKNRSCVPFFTKVFGRNGTGGVYTLPFTFYSFSAATSVEAVFLVVRGALLACMDFDFMLLTTIGVFVVGFIPSIIIAMKIFNGHAIAIWVAMYVPQFFLCFLFVVRLEKNIRTMARGDQGLWNRRSSVRNSRLGSITGNIHGTQGA